MRRFALMLVAGAALPLVTPLVSAAQEEEAETRIVTVTTFKVPFTAMDTFYTVIDKYTMPSVKANPHILSYKIANHFWGTTDHTVWIITEYENLGAIDASIEWGNKWFDDHYAEDSAERKAADKAIEEKFLVYFQHHTDNILSLNMNRRK